MKIEMQSLTDVIILQIKTTLVMFNFITQPFTFYAILWLLCSAIIIGIGGVIFKKFLERPVSRLFDYFLIKLYKKQIKKPKKTQNGKDKKDIVE